MDIIIGILLVLWCAFIYVPVMMCAMAFDAPGSEKLIWTNVIVYGSRGELLLSAITAIFFFFNLPCKFWLLGLVFLIIAVLFLTVKLGEKQWKNKKF